MEDNVLLELIYNPETKKWEPPISTTIYFPTEKSRLEWEDSLLRGDLRQVTHAHWKPGVEPPFLVCSHCEKRTCTAQTKTPYCAECGAKMDEDTMTAY